jgi:hypothetical protein
MLSSAAALCRESGGFRENEILTLFQFPVKKLQQRTASCLCPATKLKLLWSIYVPYSGHYMYRQFNIQQFYVLPTQCIYVFCVDLRTNSHYFPIQH